MNNLLTSVPPVPAFLKAKTFGYIDPKTSVLSTFSRGQKVLPGVIHKEPCLIVSLFSHNGNSYADIVTLSTRRSKTIPVETPSYVVPATDGV